MQIWQFNHPDPLRPFLKTLEDHAPHLAESGKRFLNRNAGATRDDLVRLARGLVESCETVRQAVEILLFSPPVENELDHFRFLLRWLPFWLPPGWHKYPSVSRSVAELASCLDNLQSCRPIATTIQAALKQRSQPRRQDVAELTARWQPQSCRHLLSLLSRRLPYTMTLGLQRRILVSTGLSIGQIYEVLAAAKRLTPAGACRYWRQTVQLANVTRPAASSRFTQFSEKSCREFSENVRILFWSQRRSEEIAYMESLIDYQANELVEVYNLAQEVSQRTRRVVLTLHNASLGAATGWGVPSFAQQVSQDASAAFAERVNGLRRCFTVEPGYPFQPRLANECHSLGDRVDGLFLLWSKRLVRPLLLQDLWALRVSLLLNDLPTEEWEKLFNQTEGALDDQDYLRLTQGKKSAVNFEPPTDSLRRFKQNLCWYAHKRSTRASLMGLLWSLVTTGEEWLKTGRLPHLVLPIIDKFFISSQRDQDLEYLPLFVELASINGLTPLFLLIDDTSRAKSPSLQLAIEHWRGKHPFLGLGVFASDCEPTAPSLETILACCSHCSLFALRPLTQVHNPLSLDTLLTRRVADFLSAERYDSSWKDNLPLLYHGTQVAPFAGPASSMNQFAPALITSAGPVAFGTYYRWRLRQLSLKALEIKGTGRGPMDLIWREYAPLANLL